MIVAALMLFQQTEAKDKDVIIIIIKKDEAAAE